MHAPLAELSIIPIESSDCVSKAIQQFRESKTREDQANYYRERRLAKICRRESRQLHERRLADRQLKSTSTFPSGTTLVREHSSISEGGSDKDEPCLPTPPDSQCVRSQLDCNELPCTPITKPKKKSAKQNRKYNEFGGGLGIDSPPQQRYDPNDNSQQWEMEDVEIGDVPSSVLRGVEGLWALGC
jgi:hypothetical protein